MSVNSLDDDIRRLEERIERERAVLNEAVSGCTNSVRELVTSPKTLLALAGLGFGVGKVMFGNKTAPAPTDSSVAKPGIVGLLTGVAGTALSLAGPKFGIGGMARWAISRAMSKRKKGASASASPVQRPRSSPQPR